MLSRVLSMRFFTAISKIGGGGHNLAFTTFIRQHLNLGKFDILKIVFYTSPWKVRTPGRDLLCVGVCSAAPQRPAESQCPHLLSWAAPSHSSLLLPVGCVSSQSALGLVKLSSPSIPCDTLTPYFLFWDFFPESRLSLLLLTAETWHLAPCAVSFARGTWLTQSPHSFLESKDHIIYQYQESLF